MPLESALAILRDKNNDIHLDIDITGDVNDPKFDLTDAINQALTGALRRASVSYLKFYFQPFDTLNTVAGLAGKAVRLKLDPVPFSAGTASPTSETQEYLMKVGKLLQERGDLLLKLCGKAVPKDGLEEEAARALAARRAEAAKDYFTGSFGVASDRLFVCDPEVEMKPEAIPRVELIM